MSETVQKTSPRKRRKRKKKKNPVVGVICLIGAVLLVFFACSISGPDKKETDVAATEVSAATTESSEASPEPETKQEEPVQPKISEEEFVATVQKTLDESGMDGTVTLEDNLLVVTTHNDEILGDLLAAMMGDENALNAWENMKKSFATASGNLRQSAIAAGFDDVHASIMLANPQNKENSILITMDDVIFYDGMVEMREEYEKAKN